MIKCMREYGKESGKCREFGGVNWEKFGELGQVWRNMEEVGSSVEVWKSIWG